MKQHDLDELKIELKPFWCINPKQYTANPKTRHKNTIKLPISHDVAATTKKTISFFVAISI